MAEIERSPLISEELEGQLKGLLSQLTQKVILCCVAGKDDKSKEMVQFLHHFASLSQKVEVQTSAPGEMPERDRQVDSSLLPATGIWNGDGFCRAVFHGVPGGHELSSFASAVLTAGGASKPLDKPTLKDIAKLKGPAEVRICVSLGCQHCAKLVMTAQRVAFENPAVTVHMIDANLYPQIVSQYGIERVPVVVGGGKVIGAGGMTMPEFCTLVRKNF